MNTENKDPKTKNRASLGARGISFCWCRWQGTLAQVCYTGERKTVTHHSKKSNDKTLKNEETKVVQGWRQRIVRVSGKMIWPVKNIQTCKYRDIRKMQHKLRSHEFFFYFFTFGLYFTKTAYSTFIAHWSIVFFLGTFSKKNTLCLNFFLFTN